MIDETEFDKFADEYRSIHAANIAVSGEAPEFFAEYKIKDLATELHTARPGGGTVRMLDFGAGVGTSVPFVRKHMPEARLTCLDVSAKSLAVGRERFADHAKFVHFDGGHLPMGDGTFDVVFAACVFHHIAHDEHVNILREFARVLAPGGLACVFEHNPYNPLTLHAVNTCPFDENAHLIRAAVLKQRFAAAGFQGHVRYRIFFPAGLQFLRVLERHMTWLPLGAQYFVIARKY